MQVIPGAATQTHGIVDLAKQVPTRLIRLFLRVAMLKRGQYVLYLTVSDDDVTWRLGELGHMEH